MKKSLPGYSYDERCHPAESIQIVSQGTEQFSKNPCMFQSFCYLWLEPEIAGSRHADRTQEQQKHAKATHDDVIDHALIVQ
jgi:hypothetical protein